MFLKKNQFYKIRLEYSVWKSTRIWSQTAPSFLKSSVWESTRVAPTYPRFYEIKACGNPHRVLIWILDPKSMSRKKIDF